jgi:hypothetical protein
MDILNIFEHSNARYLDAKQLAREFVWTQSFRKLLNESNHVILGSRGSGKTALVKMLSHECLSMCDSPEAKEIISKNSFIGTYIPLKVSWVKSISPIDDKEHTFFKWSLNLSSCARFVDTMRSCVISNLSNDIEILRAEKAISEQVSKFWFSKTVNTFNDISKELEDIEYYKNIVVNKKKLGLELSNEDISIGLNFNSELFAPLKKAISILKQLLNIPEEAVWCVCIDEAEFLSKEHQEVLNTHMRSFNELVFKITTLPYSHYSIDTTVGTQLNIGHDFHYLYVDRLGFLDGANRSSKANQDVFDDFAEKLFAQRIKGTLLDNNRITLKSLLGCSTFLEKPTKIYAEDEFESKLEEHFNKSINDRAKRLKVDSPQSFQDSIVRKYSGMIMLKESFKEFKGNAAPSIYSGKTLIVRCSDANPRRLLKMFNHLLSSKLQSGKTFDMIPYSEQGNKMKEFSYQELNNVNHEVEGKNVFDLIVRIGQFFKKSLHSENYNGTYYHSIKNIDVQHFKLIKKAVDLGIIYPNFSSVDDSNKMPSRAGSFSFAYCLSPYFYLMPRKGGQANFSSIVKGVRVNNSTFIDESQFEMFIDRSHEGELNE